MKPGYMGGSSCRELCRYKRNGTDAGGNLFWKGKFNYYNRYRCIATVLASVYWNGGA